MTQWETPSRENTTETLGDTMEETWEDETEKNGDTIKNL